MFYYLINTLSGEMLGESALMKNMPDPLPRESEILAKEGRQVGVYDSTTRTWIIPYKPNYVGLGVFLDALTDTEKKAFMAAAKVDADVELMREELNLRKNIDITSIRIRGMLAYLVGMHVLAINRPETIINELAG